MNIDCIPASHKISSIKKTNSLNENPIKNADFNLKNENIELIDNTSSVKPFINRVSISEYIDAKIQGEKRQKLSDDVFFIRLKHYKKNEVWAQKMKLLVYLASKMFRENQDFDKILSTIEKEIANINSSSDLPFCQKRKGPLCFFVFEDKRGEEYFKKYKNKAKDKCYLPHTNQEFQNAKTCYLNYINSFLCLGETVAIIYPDSYDENMEYVKQIYKNLKSKQSPTEDEINEACAKIQWLIAQSNPYLRGDDSIASTLTKAIYHSYDMKITPVKQGIGLDFEAFYSNLNDYIKKYPDFFEKTPVKIVH